VNIKVFCITDSLTLEVLTESSITNYKPTPRNIPEELCQLQSGGQQNSVVINLSRGLPMYWRNLLPFYLRQMRSRQMMQSAGSSKRW
jgi:hypothetical protein